MTHRAFEPPPSVRLGGFKLASRVTDMPLPVAVLTPVLMTMGVLYTLGIFPEGRFVNPVQQYHGVFPGDVYLSVGLGVAIYTAAKNLPYDPEARWYDTAGWQTTTAILALTAGAAFTGLEIWAMIADPHGPATYTARQFFSPTHMAHSVIVPWMIYLSLVIVPPTLLHAKGRWVWLQKLVTLAGYIGWGYNALYYDNTHPRPNLGNIHPLDGGWFGGWWPHVGRAVGHFLWQLAR